MKILFLKEGSHLFSLIAEVNLSHLKLFCLAHARRRGRGTYAFERECRSSGTVVVFRVSIKSKVSKDGGRRRSKGKGKRFVVRILIVKKNESEKIVTMMVFVHGEDWCDTE
jgi:hypothetical protein